MTAYTTIRLPEPLLRQVDAVVKDQGWGYSSRAEFVKEAVRYFLDMKRQSKP
ncbi:MAG: ribbon-helix-helix domain-containing protein [Candidatus Bathyarchaeia archaeon]|jgi:Arc/MetJ-type ribon-helix-helix transcriptional regulator